MEVLEKNGRGSGIEVMGRGLGCFNPKHTGEVEETTIRERETDGRGRTEGNGRAQDPLGKRFPSSLHHKYEESMKSNSSNTCPGLFHHNPERYFTRAGRSFSIS